MTFIIRPEGPVPARIMIVGEAPGDNEEFTGHPFSGTAGQELDKMLHEAKISRSECFMTYVCRTKPPGGKVEGLLALKKKERTEDHIYLRDKYVLPAVVDGFELLKKEIELVKPNVIIALGNLASWALTGNWAVMKWRGSLLRTDWDPAGPKVIPAYAPRIILAQWEHRAVMIQDLRRVAENRDSREYAGKPTFNFTLRPSLTTCCEIMGDLINRLAQGELWISFDIETRAGHIACAGISWSPTEALCIPLMCVENREGYWGADEEAIVTYMLYQILTHKNVRVRGQNIAYDSQYTHRHWHFIPRIGQDTMISQHVAFAGLPKNLGFQASMYCKHYVYWKDEGKTWDRKTGEEQLWHYNCLDCVNTDEVGYAQLELIEKMGLQEVHAFQQRLFWPVLQAMLRGVRIDKKVRSSFAMELQEEMDKREVFFQTLLGHPLNPRSSAQMIKLFYEDLNLPVQIKRATGKPTLDDNALDNLAVKEPLVKPLLKAIAEYRSLGVFLSTFVKAPLDVDGRMRCSYSISLVETYRLNSSENAFGSGTNLQNIPKGTEAKEPEDLNLPNVRKLFIPDPGYTFFDMDLDRADLQVVVWESDEEELKAALRLGVDMHLLNAFTLAGKSLPSLEQLVEGHPEYNRWRIPYKKERQLAKAFIHGTNYGGGARTMSKAAGVTVHQADKFQNIYFSRYPGIKKWHERILNELRTRRYVTNKFGYRRFYFDRIDGVLPEALAWIPQSTVACSINRSWLNIYDNLPEVQVLLQVHDSLAGQFPTHLKDWALRRMKEESLITIPYDDPLTIPVGIKTSEVSWGDCK